MEKENTKKSQTKKSQTKKETEKKKSLESNKETQNKSATKTKETKNMGTKEQVSSKKEKKELKSLEVESEKLEEMEIKDIEIEEEITTKNDEKKKIKTSDLILIIALIVVVILGFVFMQGKKVEPSYELPLTLTGEAGLHELSYSEYQEKIDNNESFVVIIERTTCSHCVNFMPVAKAFAKDNNVPMYYVDTDTFSDEDWGGFEKSNTFLKKNSGNWGTPTTVVLAGNEAVDYIEGETTSEELLELYNEYFDNDTE